MATTLTTPLSSRVPRPGATFYRPELDVLRFFAFFAVFLCHTLYFPMDHFMGRHIPMWIAKLQISVARGGQYGVDLFFALSAYLITELLLRERDARGSIDTRSFYVRRILRIWPLYYFFVGLCVVIPFLNPRHEFTLRYLIGFIFLAGNWVFVAFGYPYFAGIPLWSVSVEEQFYLLWPLIVRKLSVRGIGIVALVMIVAANLTRITMLLVHSGAWNIWINTFARLDPMAAGILLAVFLRGRVPKLSIAARILLLVACTAGIGVTGHFSAGWGDGTPWAGILISYPFIAVCSVGLLFGTIGIGIRLRPIEYLGKISYGLYVYHQMCIWITDKVLHVRNGVLHMCLREVVALALTVVFASISYAVLERPFLSLKRKFTYVSSRPI